MKKDKEDYSNVHITKVSLVNEGMKGCKVEYEKVEHVGDREYRNSFKPEMKYPVHAELIKCFGWLKGHVLSICGYDKEDEALLSRLEVTGVKADGRGFVITAKMEVYDNGKVVSLVTPFTTSEEEYLYFEDVMKIIDGIYAETKVYLSKTVVMQDQQLVIQYYDKRKDEAEKASFDKETFMRLPEQDQRIFATKILEKMKCIVIHEEEIQIPDTTGLNDELPESVKNAIAEAKKEEREEEIVESIFEFTEDEDDFSLGATVKIETPAPSTAKRKTA